MLVLDDDAVFFLPNSKFSALGIGHKYKDPTRKEGHPNQNRSVKIIRQIGCIVRSFVRFVRQLPKHNTRIPLDIDTSNKIVFLDCSSSSTYTPKGIQNLSIEDFKLPMFNRCDTICETSPARGNLFFLLVDCKMFCFVSLCWLHRVKLERTEGVDSFSFDRIWLLWIRIQLDWISRQIISMHTACFTAHMPGVPSRQSVIFYCRESLPSIIHFVVLDRIPCRVVRRLHADCILYPWLRTEERVVALGESFVAFAFVPLIRRGQWSVNFPLELNRTFHSVLFFPFPFRYFSHRVNTPIHT